MNSAVRFVALAMTVLFVVVLLLVAAARLRGPTQEQQAALALLRAAMPPVAGRDGSDAIWLLEYDVPESQRAELAKQLRAYYDAVDALALADRNKEAQALPDPRSRLSKFPVLGDELKGVCKQRDDDCLAIVRADPAATESALREHAPGLNAGLALANYDGFRYGLVPSSSQALPEFNSQRRLVRTHFAALFASGRTVEAETGLCRDIGGWRRIGGNTDTLIGSMIGAAFVRHDLELLGDMLAEQPFDSALPADCTTALAPVADFELDLCPSMRNEFRMIAGFTTREMPAKIDPKGPGSFFLKAAFDGEHVEAVMAPSFAQFCGKPLLRAQRQDRSSASIGFLATKCSLFERSGDPFGCFLAEMGSGDSFANYVDRRTDQAAALALMRTLLWLREQAPDPATWPEKLRDRPPSLGLRREPRISADGKHLSIALFERHPEDSFDLAIRR
jgi:hypothetical protein